MSSVKGMNIYEKRLTSFRPKRRPSSTAGAKPVSTKWPHEQPSPKKLAEAGFYFNPTENHPDNVTCYLCNKDLDGWESEDDPSIEHLKHCPDCGWARVAVTQAVDDDRKHVDDPRGSVMLEARLMTFGKKWWPHEDKKGWLPRMEKMADAGWHYAPSKESNDFAICAYCELSLDGWEATDSPMEEHQRRSPSCIFFNWKAAKRPTKKSRTSIQSVSSNPTPLLHSNDDEPAPKKASRTKKTKKPEPTVELEPVESIELDEPSEPTRGRKRPSAAAQGPVIIFDGSKDTDSEPDSQPPPPKKRATRASLAQSLEQARDPEDSHKMTDDSDNDSVTSRTSVVPKPAKTKKKPGRRPSKVRAPSKTRAPTGRKPKNALSDDEIDRALAADLERPLTDEEEGFKDFKKPFIRPTKRLTRSRASLAVEESAKDAPEGVLVHTSAAARRGRSRTPIGDSEKGKTPMKGFFRDSSQDFSMPVRIPQHLAQEEVLPVGGKSPERKRQEEVAENIRRGFSTEQTDEEAQQPKPKKQPKKAAKGRKKVGEMTIADEESEAPKPKRGRPPKKVVGRSRSNSAESNMQASKQILAVEVKSPQQEVTARYEQPSDTAPEKPKRGRKGKLVKGAAINRSSIISIASTAVSIPDVPEEAPEPEPEREPVAEPHQSFMDVDPAPEDVSDAGSVIRYDVSTQYPVLPAISDAEHEEPTPQNPPKRTKKTSAGVAKPTKKSTRSSVLSQATTISMVTDGAGSIINSGNESDISRASRIGAVKKGRKVAKKTSKRQLALQQNRNIEDLKKGSESFFNSSQSDELANDVKRGRGKKALGGVDTTSVRESFNGKSSARRSLVSESDDVRMVEAAAAQETKDADTRPAGNRVVSWANNGYPRLPAASEEEELSATDIDQEEEEHVRSPANIVPSLARRPLSPVRTAVNIPLAATPKSHGKNAGRVPSSKPWTAVDLEVVLANLNTRDEEEGDEVLNAREMDMTVEEWIRYSASQAELRMTSEAERIISVFEREGRRAADAVEGIDTVD